MKFSALLSLLIGATSLGAATPAINPVSPPTVLTDRLDLGSPQSEHQHALQTAQSEVTTGALGEPARRLLPGGGAAWEGGRLSFTMKVDPKEPTYLTARFWGEDVNENYLLLFCEGKQVGYRHLGDIDVLALPDEDIRYNGRFYYITTPLPPAMTKGKTELHFEIRATGKIWGYGQTFAQYQKPMNTASRGIYRVYTHTDGCFVPPAGEKQGKEPPSTLRAQPGAEVIDAVKERVNATIANLLKSERPLNQMQVQFLAKAYLVSWSHAFHNQKALDQIIAGVDACYQAWTKSPDAVWQDKTTWNPGWFGVGPAADAVRLLAGPLEPALDQKIAGDGKTRRAAWSELFQASRDWLRTHRRWLANQAMFTDTNLYLSNRAVAAIDPGQAFPEEKALRYLYESVGLLPWLGIDTDHGSEKPFGDAFYQVTSKGLTKELGYVGDYGEGGAAGAMEIYDATRPPGGEGDPKLKAQLAKMLRARGVFRYPMLDEDNHPAMRLETGVGWRDTHFPGRILYAQRAGGEESPLRMTAATLDPYAIGYVQQMFADNQFFSTLAHDLADKRFRTTTGLLGVPDEYELLRRQPPSPHRLPMTWSQPDFVFADEENGVVGIKNGNEILFASLYWRAGFGINFLARTHYLTPAYEQVAVVREDVVFEASGLTYTRPNWINFGFGNGGMKYPGNLQQAFAGEELPIAKMPPGVPFKAGDSNYFAGRGQFYTLRYGPYLIGMNCTPNQTFELKIPAGAGRARNIATGEFVPMSRALKVGPASTFVLYLGPSPAITAP
ncbi:MAG: hypothetical protein JF599_08055 [Verrucomicrobia bacterium]|nr:hypothetical protein [Verrucomicrobiota bacterium]